LTIAIVGATGKLGQPVARELKARGHNVRIVSRNIDKAREMFGSGFDYATCDLAENINLDAAFAKCDAVHLNLDSDSAEEAEAVEHRGVVHAATAAKRAGVKRVGLISGDFEVNPDQASPRRSAKSKGIIALQNSGVPYMVFACSWFMEELPDFIIDGEALMFGNQPLDFHWINQTDYANMVANGYENPKAANKYFAMHGPQGIKMLDALKQYCSIAEPAIPVKSVSLAEANEMAKQPGKEWIAGFARFMATFETDGDWGDPTEAYELLGFPKITIEAWAKSVAAGRR
jgi:uncharacterized protein YbjT (DUF2867 family)